MPDLAGANLLHLSVTLRAKSKPELFVQGLQGPDGWKITSGYAGLTEISRPRRVSMVHYQGAPPLHMVGDIVFDTWTWIPEATVDGDYQNLEIMAGLDPKHSHPYVINVEAPNPSIPHKEVDWFIWDLTWGDFIRNTEGQLKRQVVSIELVEAVVPGYERKIIDQDNIDQPSKGHGRFHETPKNKKFYGTWVVKKGDTLQFISKEIFGTPKYWKRIAIANSIVNPKRLPVGIKLKIPRPPGYPQGIVETAG
jgi:LysM domain